MTSTGDRIAPQAAGNAAPMIRERISVVIVSWNTRELLTKCLASVVSQEFPKQAVEIWVVDNASQDGSAELVRSSFPEVNLIANAENAGFARANNQAIRAGEGDLILLLNSDAVLHPGALAAMQGYMQRHPETGALGPLVLNPDGSLQTSCYPAPTLAREFWRLFHLDQLRAFGVYEMSRWDRTADRPVDVILGACLMLRRAALEDVGPISEDYFMYSEDLDICHRLRSAGWRTVWFPGAAVTHYGGQSTRQQSRAMFLRLYESKLLFFRKYHGSFQAFLYRLILVFSAFARVLLSPLALLSTGRRRRRRLELAGNYGRLALRLLFG